jgi:hypothetical protein
MNIAGRLRGLAHRLIHPLQGLRDLSEPVDELTKLADRFGSDKGLAAFAGHGYTRIYSALFAPLRDMPLRLLEIGLLHPRDAASPHGGGGEGCAVARRAPSLAMWSAYFPKAQIFGFDIGDFSRVAIERCTILRGDMGSRDDLRRLLRDSGGAFDIVIDDGSHASHHQQIALATLFPAVASGGVYIVEDLDHQPPELEPSEAVKTVDMLRRAEAGGGFASPHLDAAECAYLNAQVAGIALYDAFDRRKPLPGRDALAILRKR